MKIPSWVIDLILTAIAQLLQGLLGKNDENDSKKSK